MLKKLFYTSASIFLLALARLALSPSAQAGGGYVYVTQWV